MDEQDFTEIDYALESAYGSALTAVAIGEERERTRLDLLNAFPILDTEQTNDILADALRDALKQGIEREDIDPSWF